MRKTKLNPYITAFSLVLLVSFLFNQNSCASQSNYTIQTGSFFGIKEARKQYGFIMNKLNQREIEHLRIEKIGKYYVVRIGIFQEFAKANRLYQTVKTHIPGAAIKYVPVKDERIIQTYEPPPADRLNAKEEAGAPGKTESQRDGDRVDKETGQPSPETIASISFLVEKNDYKTALDLVKAEMNAHPEHPDLNAWRGMVLLKMDEPLEALKYLKKAVELSPDVPDYYNGLGYSFFFLEKYEAAIDAFDHAIKLDPRHIDARTGLCMSYAKTGNRGKALEMLGRLKDLDMETSDRLLKIINGVKGIKGK